MNKKGWAILGVLVTLATGAAPAAGQAQDERYVYLGASAGGGASKKACDGALSCDETDNAAKLFGGYQFNRNVALELGYASLGDYVTNGIETRVRVFDAVALFTAPISQRFAIIGRFGAYRSDVDQGGGGGSHNTSFTWGLGLQYDLGRSLGLRAEWQQYPDIEGGGAGTDDIDYLSLGVVVRF